MKSLGQRMKEFYEAPYRHQLPRRQPLVIRVDGRAFHTWTRGLQKPYDKGFACAMLEASLAVAGGMQGCVIVYVQSDEASFVLQDWKQLETEAWFGYDQSKVETLAASMMTHEFAQAASRWILWPGDDQERPALFDARSFSMPREEVANYILWRVQDAQRNSISGTAREHFSHKELHGKNSDEMLEMLREDGLDWRSLPSERKYGYFYSWGWANTGFLDKEFARRDSILPVYDRIAALVNVALPAI